MKLLAFEEEEENCAPIAIDDDDKYDNTDLFCEEDDEEDNDLCSGCDENPMVHLVQTCGFTVCTNCVKKNNCQLRGCPRSNNITIALDDFERFFHVFQCFNPKGAPSIFFQLVYFGQVL